MTPEERDRLAILETEMKMLFKQLNTVAADTKAIREQANKWKGALGVILGLGGLIGFLSGWLKDWFLK